jgi:hypothetical protein
LRQQQTSLATPGTEHVQRRFLAGAIERAAQSLAVDRHGALPRIGEPGHEAPKRGTQPCRVELSEQAAAGVLAGQAMLKLEQAAQQAFFCIGEPRHRHSTLATAQDGAKRDQS